MGRKRVEVGAICAFLCLVGIVAGDNSKFANQQVGLRENGAMDEVHYIHHTACMFTLADTPAAGFEEEESYIKVELHSVKSSEKTVEVVVYSSEVAELVGYNSLEEGVFGDDEGVNALCCTQDFIDEVTNSNLLLPNGCSSPSDIGNVIINGNDERIHRVKRPVPEPFAESGQTIMNLPTAKKGMYFIIITSCEDVIDISGHVEWLNPYGFLSGDLYAYVPFYGILAFNYFALGVVWTALCLYYHDRLIPLQLYIGAIIALGVFESTTWFFDFWSENQSGSYLILPTMLGVLLDTTKRTVSRALLLVVSMGYGVVKATLGADAFKVGFISVLYFVFSGSYQFIEQTERRVHMHTDDDVSTADVLQTIFVFPVALLDTIFYWWVGISLIRTIAQLKARKQSAKLGLYQKFFVGLVLSALLSAGVILYQVWVVSFTGESDRWETTWFFNGFWNAMYFVLLALVAFLWRPQENNTRYAYNEAEDVELDEDGKDGASDSEAKSKDTPNSGQQVKKRKVEREEYGSYGDMPSETSVAGMSGGSASGSEQGTEVELLEMPIPTFTIESDEEEEEKIE